MLEQLPSILAADDEDIGKIIFGAIAALIWAVSAFVSWANKKTQEAKRRAQEELMRRQAQAQAMGLRVPPPIPPRPAQQRIADGIAARYPQVLMPPAPQQQRPRVRQGPVPPPIPQARPMPMPPKPKRRGKPVKAPMPPPPVPQTRTQEQIEAAILLDETPVGRRETQQRKSAVAQMLTPRSLRNQFVLLEILQPPLALRDERER